MLLDRFSKKEVLRMFQRKRVKGFIEVMEHKEGGENE